MSLLAFLIEHKLAELLLWLKLHLKLLDPLKYLYDLINGTWTTWKLNLVFDHCFEKFIRVKFLDQIFGLILNLFSGFALLLLFPFDQSRLWAFWNGLHSMLPEGSYLGTNIPLHELIEIHKCFHLKWILFPWSL